MPGNKINPIKIKRRMEMLKKEPLFSPGMSNSQKALIKLTTNTSQGNNLFKKSFITHDYKSLFGVKPAFIIPGWDDKPKP